MLSQETTVLLRRILQTLLGAVQWSQIVKVPNCFIVKPSRVEVFIHGQTLWTVSQFRNANQKIFSVAERKEL